MFMDSSKILNNNKISFSKREITNIMLLTFLQGIENEMNI